MSSVIRAIFFYSRRNSKSIDIKQIIEELNIDIEAISVDNSTTRELLLSDTKYFIDQVPALLVLYSTGQHRVYTNDKLDTWLEQLIENVRQEYQQQHQQTPLYSPSEPEPEYPISKPLMSRDRSDIRSNLSAPGIRSDSGLNSEQQRIASSAIKDTDSESISGIKKDGMTPAQIAKQQIEERERIEEEIDNNKQPF